MILPIAELFHALTRFGAVLFDIGAVARQRLQYLPRHAPRAVRRRHHVAADCPFPFVQDIEEGLAIECQTHRPAQLRIVEGRSGRIDKHRARHVACVDFAQCLWRLFLEVL